MRLPEGWLLVARQREVGASISRHAVRCIVNRDCRPLSFLVSAARELWVSRAGSEQQPHYRFMIVFSREHKGADVTGGGRQVDVSTRRKQ